MLLFLFGMSIFDAINIFLWVILLGAGLWTGIHYIFEFTNLFFPKSWRKPFQVLIGIALIVVSAKIFMLA